MPSSRAAVEAEIDRLINLLDAADGNCDDEDGHDAEPWLGWQENAGRGCPSDSSYRFAADIGQPIGNDDREEENENGGDVVDEPHDNDFDREDDARDWPMPGGDDADFGLLAEVAGAWQHATPEARERALAYARTIDPRGAENAS